MLAWTLLCVVATLLVAPVRVEADGIPLRAARKPLKNNNGSANLKMLLAEVQTVSRYVAGRRSIDCVLITLRR